MENRKELNLVVVNIVLLLLLMSLCVGCSKTVESDLNLKCEGKHISTFDSKKQKREELWKEFLSFKDKRRYSIERNDYLGDKCHIWTNELIECSVETDDESKVGEMSVRTYFLSKYVVNRVTGEVKVTIRLNEDEDYYTGICEKIDGKKL
jgi:hypothetical protein